MQIIHRKRGPAPDYTWVDSREKAWRLVEAGNLVAILMLPEMFGGTEDDRNIVFLPPEVADHKDRIDDEIVVPLIQRGPPVEYAVEPEYAGTSLVPNGLKISVLAPEPHVYFLDIWGPSPTLRA